MTRALTLSRSALLAGLALAVAGCGTSATDPARNCASIPAEADPAGYYLALHFVEGELNNFSTDQSIYGPRGGPLMRLPWVRIHGSGVDAEAPGDPATVRQIRIGLFEDGANDTREPVWQDTSDDAFIGEITECCTFEMTGTGGFGPGESRGTQNQQEFDGTLSASGRLEAGQLTGMAGYRVTCEGFEDQVIEGDFLVITPQWTTTDCVEVTNPVGDDDDDDGTGDDDDDSAASTMPPFGGASCAIPATEPQGSAWLWASALALVWAWGRRLRG